MFKTGEVAIMMIRPLTERVAQGAGSCMIWLLPVIAVDCAVALGALAASPAQLEWTFRQLDMDGDGQVTTTEFENKKIYVFSLRDASGDNMVQRDEVDLDAHQFQAVDTDGDGEISGFEFVEAPIGQFATYDTDGNGLMTLEELKNAAGSSTSRP